MPGSPRKVLSVTRMFMYMPLNHAQRAWNRTPQPWREEGRERGGEKEGEVTGVVVEDGSDGAVMTMTGTSC